MSEEVEETENEIHDEVDEFLMDDERGNSLENQGYESEEYGSLMYEPSAATIKFLSCIYYIFFIFKIFGG
jgi:hypothetical protein